MALEGNIIVGLKNNFEHILIMSWDYPTFLWFLQSNKTIQLTVQVYLYQPYLFKKTTLINICMHTWIMDLLQVAWCEVSVKWKYVKHTLQKFNI